MGAVHTCTMRRMQEDLRSPQVRWACQAAVPAVVAGYALLEALQTCRRQALSAEDRPGRAPFNRIAHSPRTWTHADRDFNTPTVDLLYSNAWIDLRAGPVLLDVPPRSRFFVVELLDAWTNNFLNLGTRNVPAKGARYALLGPDTPEHVVPAGCIVVQCPTALVWLLGRVIVDDAADLPAACAVQQGFRLHGEPVQAPFQSLAQWQDTGDTARDFHANLARALADFPPRAGQQAPFELLAAAHIRLGDLATLRSATAEGLRLAHAEGMALIEGHAQTASRAPWRYSTRLGRFGNDFMLRAATAWKGIGALSADEALYAAADYDSQGEPLDGRRAYRIRLPDGGQLPVDAFWSITLYGSDRFLAANALGRHALGSRSGLQAQADGSVSLHVGHRQPDAPLPNWLPAPEGPFYLVLRLYHPRAELLEGRHPLPVVERV